MLCIYPVKGDTVDEVEADLAKWAIQLRKGGLALAVLAALWCGELYGLEILRRLDSIAQFTVPEGTIYPLLTRLKAANLVESRWAEADAGHPRKYYQLTAHGRRQVRVMAQAWFDFASGMTKLLAPVEEKARARRKAV